MRPATAQSLRDAGLDPDEITRLVRATLAEDLGEAGDITSLATVPADARLTVRYVTRRPGTAAGLYVLAAMVDEYAGDDAGLTLLATDGDRLAAGQPLAQLSASARAVLSLERTSLNLLGHLCGVATSTRAWSDAMAGTKARVRDTRKTMPLLRSLEKYAVRCGGGVNHRTGLYDAVLIKDNHVAAAGGVGPAVDAALAAYGDRDVVIQVEVDDLDQLAEALDHRAPQVLIDNFDLEQTKAAVAMVAERSPSTIVESSGGLTLDRAAEIAATGVDYLAVGALTHSTVNLDIGLDAVPA